MLQNQKNLEEATAAGILHPAKNCINTLRKTMGELNIHKDVVLLFTQTMNDS